MFLYIVFKLFDVFESLRNKIISWRKDKFHGEKSVLLIQRDGIKKESV